jgi:UDP-N-acetylmuramate--alanine ligase
MKHIYFSGIGGAGLGPLAEIAQDAGYNVSGSDLNESPFSLELESRGVDVVYEQNLENIKAEHLTNPIDWLVQTSALPDDHPELEFARQNGIKISKRDEFLNEFLQEHDLQLIAVAGTHGKTTTTGALIWLFEQLGLPVSYSIGAKLSFGPSGKYDENSKYFVYEADEYDRNFLKFTPKISVLPSVDYDHSDIYKTRADYQSAFRKFVEQSEFSIMFEKTENYLQPLQADYEAFEHSTSVDEINLPGQAQRDDAFLAKQVLKKIGDFDEKQLNQALSAFPGTSRRFEKLAPNLYSDYAHHPAEISATIGLAKEINPNVVVIYQPHQNERQLQLIDDYKNLFSGVKQVYWLATYQPDGQRGETENILKPATFVESLKNTQAEVAEMNDELWNDTETHIAGGDLVLAMSAGTLDGWLRQRLAD